MVWGRETVTTPIGDTWLYKGLLFSAVCTSLRSGSVSGLEVSVVVEELSSSAKESFNSSSCCFPFPLLSFSSRFFCGLTLRWIVFPFPRKVRMLQILSSSAQRWASSLHFGGHPMWLSLWSLLPVTTHQPLFPLCTKYKQKKNPDLHHHHISAPEPCCHCLSVDVGTWLPSNSSLAFLLNTMELNFTVNYITPDLNINFWGWQKVYHPNKWRTEMISMLVSWKKNPTKHKATWNMTSVDEKNHY